MSQKMKRTIIAVVLVAVAMVSMFGVSKITTSPEHHKATIETLDEKRDTVLALTAASTAASAAITLIPGDTATPIAEKLADLSGYFIVILCAIFIEKYLLTITGYATFVILIPAACVLFAVYVFKRNDALKQIAVKLLLFGLAIYMIVPVSTGVSNMIEATYKTSIEETLASAENTTEAIENESQKEEDSGVLDWFSDVKEGATSAMDTVRNTLNNFVEAIAVMIVTSCILPILVLAFFVWIIKITLGLDLNLSAISKMPRR